MSSIKKNQQDGYFEKMLHEDIVFNEPKPETDENMKRFMQKILSSKIKLVTLGENDKDFNRDGNKYQKTPLSSAKRKRVMGNYSLIPSVKRRINFNEPTDV